MNPNTQNVDQESVETLADLNVPAEQASETNAGAGAGKVSMNDFNFVQRSEPDLNNLTS